MFTILNDIGNDSILRTKALRLSMIHHHARKCLWQSSIISFKCKLTQSNQSRTQILCLCSSTTPNLTFLANSSSLQCSRTLLKPSIPWPNPPSPCLCTYQWVASPKCLSLCFPHAQLCHIWNPCELSALFEGTVGHCRTAFLLNTLIRAYSIARVHDGFQSYNCMVRRPDDLTFLYVLKVCSDFVDNQKGMGIHGFVLKLGFNFDVSLGILFCRFMEIVGN